MQTCILGLIVSFGKFPVTEIKFGAACDSWEGRNVRYFCELVTKFLNCIKSWYILDTPSKLSVYWCGRCYLSITTSLEKWNCFAFVNFFPKQLIP
jgi:hypothetical protein